MDAEARTLTDADVQAIAEAVRAEMDGPGASTDLPATNESHRKPKPDAPALVEQMIADMERVEYEPGSCSRLWLPQAREIREALRAETP